MEPNEFSKSMAVLAVGMKKPLSKQQMDVWYECLKDLSSQQLQEAVLEFLKAGDDWPTIAKLRRLAGEITPVERATVAWKEVLGAIRGIGAYESVNFTDLLCNAVVRSLGGWERICDTTVADMTWLEKDFHQTYRAFMATGVGGDMCKPLPGIHAVSNGKGGFNIEDACDIGTNLPAPPQKSITSSVPERKRIEMKEYGEAVDQLAHWMIEHPEELDEEEESVPNKSAAEQAAEIRMRFNLNREN